MVTFNHLVKSVVSALGSMMVTPRSTLAKKPLYTQRKCYQDGGFDGFLQGSRKRVP